MATINFEYHPEYPDTPYFVKFNPCSNQYGIEEASAFYSSFENSLYFLTQQITERTSDALPVGKYSLTTKGDLPLKQKKF